jgi:hypothetical protein
VTCHDPVGFHDVDFGGRLEGNLLRRLGDAAPEFQLIVVDARFCHGGQLFSLLEQSLGGADQIEG